MAIALVELQRRRPARGRARHRAWCWPRSRPRSAASGSTATSASNRRPGARAWTTIDGPAIVFVGRHAGLPALPQPVRVNGPDLDDQLLYAVDADPEMLDLIAEQPERTPYLQLATAPQEDLGPKEDPEDFDVVLLPVEVPARSRARAHGDRRTTRVPTPSRPSSVEAAGRSIRRSVPAGTPLPPSPSGRPGSATDFTVPDRGLLRITLGAWRHRGRRPRAPPPRSSAWCSASPTRTSRSSSPRAALRPRGARRPHRVAATAHHAPS